MSLTTFLNDDRKDKQIIPFNVHHMGLSHAKCYGTNMLVGTRIILIQGYNNTYNHINGRTNSSTWEHATPDIDWTTLNCQILELLLQTWQSINQYINRGIQE